MEAASTRVLLVEDEFSDALFVRRSLRSAEGTGERFEVRRAGSLAHGLAQLREEAVDVLLVDLRLPDSDGPNTVARLRDQDGRIPLVVFTGTDDPELAARSFAAGADEYLVKDDLGAELLRRTIRHAIERQRLRLRAVPKAAAPVRESSGRERSLLHDLKNVHTCILGNAGLLREELGDGEPVRRRVDALLAAARTAIALTRRLLEGGEGGEAWNPFVELSELVRRAETLLRATLPGRVELRLELAEGLPCVSARVERLRGALLELVVNAVETIGDGVGRIEVRTGAAVLDGRGLPGLVAPGGIGAGPHAWLEVRDTGRGFDPATLSNLLEPGFSTRGPARGHGLSDLVEILAEHRGTLAVGSCPGAGSTFRILLPSRG